MKFKLAAAVLCTAGIAVTAFAGDAEDVKATIAKAAKAHDSCDVETMKTLSHEKFFGFNMDGTVYEGNDMAAYKAQCDAGTKFDMPMKVAKVHVGKNWAVAAGTFKGTETPVDGEARNVDAHFTVVLVKDGDGWKSIHFHASPNLKAPPASE